MISDRDRFYLEHILEEIRFLRTHCAVPSSQSFEADEVLSRAAARSLEIIGEAAKNVSEGLRTKRPDIPWRKMAGLRDVLIHSYFGINWDIVWDVITVKLPELESDLALLLAT